MPGDSLLKISRIVEFFDDHGEGLAKGENAYQSKHVNFVTYDSQLNFLTAKVWASMRKVLNDVLNSILYNITHHAQLSYNCSLNLWFRKEGMLKE